MTPVTKPCLNNKKKLQYLERKPHELQLSAGFQVGPLSWSNCNLQMLIFVEGENRRIREKTLGARREPITNSFHIWYRVGIEPRPHWWEASVLTSAPSLLTKHTISRSKSLGFYNYPVFLSRHFHRPFYV